VGGSGTTNVWVLQRIESSIAAALSGQTVTVQAQIFNDTGATITPQLEYVNPTAYDTWSSTGTYTTVSLQPCPNGEWTRVAYTFTAPAASNLGLQIALTFGALTNAQYVSVTELDIRVTPGVAVGLNSSPPPPELRPLPIELPFCRYYFQTSYNLGTPPGTATTVGSQTHNPDGQNSYVTVQWPST
jgi:hypothetical protein